MTDLGMPKCCEKKFEKKKIMEMDLTDFATNPVG